MLLVWILRDLWCFQTCSFNISGRHRISQRDCLWVVQEVITLLFSCFLVCSPLIVLFFLYLFLCLCVFLTRWIHNSNWNISFSHHSETSDASPGTTNYWYKYKYKNAVSPTFVEPSTQIVGGQMESRGCATHAIELVQKLYASCIEVNGNLWILQYFPRDVASDIVFLCSWNFKMRLDQAWTYSRVVVVHPLLFL